MVGERRCSGKEFHVLGAATGKLRLSNSVLICTEVSLGIHSLTHPRKRSWSILTTPEPTRDECSNRPQRRYDEERRFQPLSDVDSRRRIRSASTAEVLVPATRRSTIGDRAFAVAGSRAWNNLPVDLRLSRTFTIFKTHLKSHLFNLSFPSV